MANTFYHGIDYAALVRQTRELRRRQDAVVDYLVHRATEPVAPTLQALAENGAPAQTRDPVADIITTTGTNPLVTPEVVPNREAMAAIEAAAARLQGTPPDVRRNDLWHDVMLAQQVAMTQAAVHEEPAGTDMVTRQDVDAATTTPTLVNRVTMQDIVEMQDHAAAGNPEGAARAEIPVQPVQAPLEPEQGATAQPAPQLVGVDLGLNTRAYEQLVMTTPATGTWTTGTATGNIYYDTTGNTIVQTGPLAVPYQAEDVPQTVRVVEQRIEALMRGTPQYGAAAVADVTGHVTTGHTIDEHGLTRFDPTIAVDQGTRMQVFQANLDVMTRLLKNVNLELEVTRDSRTMPVVMVEALLGIVDAYKNVVAAPLQRFEDLQLTIDPEALNVLRTALMKAEKMFDAMRDFFGDPRSPEVFWGIKNSLKVPVKIGDSGLDGAFFLTHQGPYPVRVGQRFQEIVRAVRNRGRSHGAAIRAFVRASRTPEVAENALSVLRYSSHPDAAMLPNLVRFLQTEDHVDHGELGHELDGFDLKFRVQIPVLEKTFRGSIEFGIDLVGNLQGGIRMAQNTFLADTHTVSLSWARQGLQHRFPNHSALVVLHGLAEELVIALLRQSAWGLFGPDQAQVEQATEVARTELLAQFHRTCQRFQL